MPSIIQEPVECFTAPLLSAPLPKPSSVKLALPLDEKTERNVQRSRDSIRGLLSHQTSDYRLVVVVGPCSIHDTGAALDYATLLAAAAKKHHRELLIVMRVYVESQGRVCLTQNYAQCCKEGLPVATELLNPLLAYFFEDIVSLGVIGARTTESQTHREMASAMPMPMGFKNGMDGGVKVAIDAMKAASRSHTVVGVDEEASLAYHMSRGNPDSFVILRGGSHGPNFSPEHIRDAERELLRAGKKPCIMVDCSHGNSMKDYRNQGTVAACLADQIAVGAPIMGVMLESNINEGRQDVPVKGANQSLKYGVSITDGCVGWHETELILNRLAAAVRQRHAVSTTGSAVVESIPTMITSNGLDVEKRPVEVHVTDLNNEQLAVKIAV